MAVLAPAKPSVERVSAAVVQARTLERHTRLQHRLPRELLTLFDSGCWEVTAQVGDREDAKITFVTRVEKIGDGPAWRR
jgi:hypothetical protein